MPVLNLAPRLMEQTTATARLHSPSAVTLATLIGMPVAGTFLLAQNYRTLGNPRAARHCMIWGISTTLILLLVGSLMNIPSMILPISYTIGMHNAASAPQGRAFRAHLDAGGLKKSLWQATGIGSACMLVVLGGLFILALFSQD